MMMERRNRRRWEEEQEEKTTGWLMMPPGMFFFHLCFFYFTHLYYHKRTFSAPNSTRLCTKHPFLHQVPIFFTPPALSYPGYCPFLHQAPVFCPTCTQLPRLPFPRGPNNKTLFHCLCPRLEMRLEPRVSFLSILCTL